MKQKRDNSEKCQLRELRYYPDDNPFGEDKTAILIMMAFQASLFLSRIAALTRPAQLPGLSVFIRVKSSKKETCQTGWPVPKKEASRDLAASRDSQRV